MDRVKFYSEWDMACGIELNKIADKINVSSFENQCKISDIIEFHNILKYLEIKRFSDYIEEVTHSDSKILVKELRKKIGQFLGVYGSNYAKLYDEIDFIETEDYLEIIEEYKLYEKIGELDFKELLNKEYVHIYMVLQFKRLTEHCDSFVKERILSDPRNAETIISKYLGETTLFLPPSLLSDEVVELIDRYIDSSEVNINYLRSIITFPTNRGLIIPDKVKLHAKRKEIIENEKIFSNGTGIESSVSITYPTDLNEEIIITKTGTSVDIKVSRKWIEENQDLPTLWNNFIHLFNIVDDKFRLTLVSKTNGMSALESAFSPSGSHLYKTSFGFNFMEMIANAEVYSYIQVMNTFNIRIEDMIEWFFMKYLKDEFSIENFVVKMPSDVTPYFEKCRSILPEIDRVFKQYNALVEDGEIDQELIQLSSSSFKNNEIKSFNTNKYVYPLDGWCKTASYLLFSDQSGIFYLPSKKEKYRNFLDLVVKDSVKKSDFLEHQLHRMQWLFDNELIFENDDGYIKIVDIKTVYILKEFYYEDVLSYWHYHKEIRSLIDDFERKNYVTFESTLLSRNEQDYLDYYLNKSKFTNGFDIRNRYLHGTNGSDENQYKTDYYLILKLFIIIVIKINDDLCIKEDYEANPL
ncbi:hypothetical protein [Alkaliphilus oremlandii]|uniref:hypothetical protein n=1 Tax=Alkaliphilus oremlandii TaxID=461876 RepID=UPI00030E1501|nr:hypothetical protein [Alkaliphilus oremlandii]